MSAARLLDYSFDAERFKTEGSAASVCNVTQLGSACKTIRLYNIIARFVYRMSWLSMFQQWPQLKFSSRSSSSVDGLP